MTLEREAAVHPALPSGFRARLQAAFNDPAIIHYVYHKPWSPFPVHLRREFLRVARKTPWKQVRFSTRELDWRQKRALLRAWKHQILKVCIRRDEVALHVLGRPMVHWARPLGSGRRAA